MTFAIYSEPDRLLLDQTAEQQLCYCLVTITPPQVWQPAAWAVVVDASRSMRIPVLSDEQFRELVRAGGVEETLVDGVPVWELSAPLPSAVRARVRSALDWVAVGLEQLAGLLHRDDEVGLIGCADRAQVLIEGTSDDHQEALARGAAALREAQLGDETDLSGGIDLALKMLRARGGSLRRGTILLLTDGFTSARDRCRALARAAVAEQVAISAISLGAEVEDELLLELAETSGGRARAVDQLELLPAALSEELRHARTANVAAATLAIDPAAGVAVRRATLVGPQVKPLEVRAVLNTHTVAIPLDDIGRQGTRELLLELVVTAATTGGLHVAECRLLAQAGTLAHLQLAATYSDAPRHPPTRVLRAAAHANVARLHQRALAALHAGRCPEGLALLEALAQRLDELGHNQSAATLRHETRRLQQLGTVGDMSLKVLHDLLQQL